MKHFITSLFLLLLCGFSWGQTFDASQLLKPESAPNVLVSDFTNTLTPSQKKTLEDKLVAIDDKTSTQIAVVIVPTTGGVDVADYATELGRAWGVGGKQFNNGVVLLIAKDDRKLNISTGYGLEGSLTDAASSHIIDEVITPNFKGDDYYRGIDEGTDAIISAVQGTYEVPRDRSSGGGKSKLFFIIFLILLIFILSRGGGKGGGTFMSRRGFRGVGGPIVFFPTGGGDWGGGGSSGGGGFGGFGGGGFGGGGASGSW